MGIYQLGRKIGYSRRSLSSAAEGFTLSEESVLRLTVLDTPQTVRTRTRATLSPDFGLREIDFQLHSGVGRLQATGAVAAGELRISVQTGAEISSQVLHLSGPLYLPSALRALVTANALQKGREIEASVFDPTSLRAERLLVVVEVEEPVPESTPRARAWRVREEFRGVRTTAWIDANGQVLREEGPMGLVLIREDAEAAATRGWTSDAALDVTSAVAVPVALPITNPRGRTALRVRLSGVPLDRVPTDDEQQLNGAVLSVKRRGLATLRSYALPCAEDEHQDDLEPTPFLQTTHPRVAALARDIVADERDAIRAAQRLNDWVYAHLRKVPTVSIPNAVQVLEMGEGDCNEHAVLLAALGRAAGIPTRVVAGAVYLEEAFLYHAWCEMWLGRWVSIDPALHQFPADATHIKFVVGGPEEHSAMLGIIGQLRVDVLDETSALDARLDE
jgi:transglutaminase-like putative cysteine protease